MSMNSHRQAGTLRPPVSKTQMSRYFYPRKVSAIAYVFFVAGIVVLGSCTLQISIYSLGIALPLILTSTIWIIAVRRSNPTDQEYDQWLKERTAALLPETLWALDLDQSKIYGQIQYIPTFVLPGSQRANQYRPGEVLVKQGKDRQWRFSINAYAYLIPTDRSVIVLTRDISAFSQWSDIWQNEEYPYQHIVNATIGTFQESACIDGKRYRYCIKQICLKISNGETMPVGACFSATSIDPNWYAPDFTRSDRYLNQTLNNLRGLLRAGYPKSRR